MPPKRKTRSETAVSASQPEPQRPRRSSARSRQYSDGSTSLDVPASSQPNIDSGVTKTPAKRGRPQRKSAAPEVIVEEEDEDEVTNETTTPACEAQAESVQGSPSAGDEESIQVSQSSNKHVHFDGTAEDCLIEKSTATYITPHPRTKMSIKRRRTVSPAEEGSVKRLKNTRTSLPASLSQEEPTQIIQEVRFSPLRKILDERIRRLSALRNEVIEDGVNIPTSDENMLVLDDTEEFSVAQLPTSPHSPLVNGSQSSKGKSPALELGRQSTPGSREQGLGNAERKKFEEAILALTKEVDEAKAQIHILDIEIETIGFGEEGASSLEVLQSIRESFAGVREFLEFELPGSLPDNASNQDLSEILVANVEEFANRLRTASKELQDKGALANELGGQINSLLDRLAKREIERSELLDQVGQLEGSTDLKDRDIEKLAAELHTAKKERDGLVKNRDGEMARADGLETEKTDLQKNIGRLSESLQKYHSEEARLTDKINTLEEEHRKTVSAMNKEREGTVRDLEGRIDKVTTQHAEVTKLASERERMMGELNVRVEAIETERDDLNERLKDMTADRDIEQAARLELEDDLGEKNDEVEDLEARVRQLEEELDEYNEQLDNLRQLSETERSQREAAEKDLDAHTATIDEINEKLREKGKEANELRQKLFEVQGKNDKKIKDLETAASDRDHQFQEDMAREVRRREGAENLAKERAAITLDLQQQLEQVEKQMRDLLAEKTNQLNKLQDELAQKDAEIQNLRDSLQSNETVYETEIQRRTTRIQNLETEVATLEQTIAEGENTVRNLEQQADANAQTHGLELEARGAKIAVLNDQLAELKVQKDDLEKERAKLARRVEDEAENMLEYQNGTAAEIQILQHTIRDKQMKIQAVESKVRETDRRWEEVLTAREEQIQNLTTATERQTETINTLKHRFGDYVRRSSSFIVKLQEQVEAAKIHVDEEGHALQSEGNDLLGEMMELEVPGKAKKRTSGRKRREYDSGVGLSIGGVASPTTNDAVEMLSS